MTEEKEKKEGSYFEKLNSISVKDYIEIKDKLKYISWVNAYKELMKIYPDFNYKIHKFENNLPYVYDEKTGYMVFTEVTIEGKTKEMFLPVMNSSNRAMKNTPYTVKTKWKEIRVEAATMFDINKTIMRCLVKNIAMFGLGLYLYAGEDLPEEEKSTNQKIAQVAVECFKEADKERMNELGDKIKVEFMQARDEKKLNEVAEKYKKDLAFMRKCLPEKANELTNVYKNCKSVINNELDKFIDDEIPDFDTNKKVG